MTVTGMLIYSVLIILHYYFFIIFVYDNIILSYYHIILTQYSIYWHFFNQGFCSRMAPYQWIWIIKDCFRHRISARVFSMLIHLFSFWAQSPWGPGPWSPLGPVGPPIFWICLTFCKMVRDLSRSVPMVFRSLGTPHNKLFHFIFNSEHNVSEVHAFI